MELAFLGTGTIVIAGDGMKIGLKPEEGGG